MTATTPNFKRMVADASKGLVLKPLLQAYLYEAKFPERFEVTFHKAGVAREPDGWFHPSTHPLMDARQLYYYLTTPAAWEVERFSYESRMAVTMGTAVHGFLQFCIRDAGWMAPLPTGDCVACGLPHGIGRGQCDEFGVSDPVLRRRGHMDGMLDVMGTRSPLELKTGGRTEFHTDLDLDLDWFKEKHATYYAQVQEYLDITGYARFVVLFVNLGFPWKLTEIHVPYDLQFARRTREKYELVRAHEEAGVPPQACCPLRSARSRDCPAGACPVKAGR